MKKDKYDKSLNEMNNQISDLIFHKVYDLLSFKERETVECYIHDLQNPLFKPIIINGIDNGYKISNTGIIIDKNFKEVKYYVNNSGYKTSWLRGFNKNKKNSTPILVHRLVAETFIPNPDNKPEVNHINCDQTFNWVGNLEWVTHEENIHYSNNLGHKVIGEAHKNAKCTNEQIHKVCKLLEENKLSIIDIAKECNVPIRTIRHIRFDSGWKHISKHYNIPFGKRANGPRFSPLSHLIIDLINENKSDIEIFTEIKKSELSQGVSDKSIRDRIYHIHKITNVETSTTIENQ